MRHLVGIIRVIAEVKSLWLTPRPQWIDSKCTPNPRDALITPLIGDRGRAIPLTWSVRDFEVAFLIA